MYRIQKLCIKTVVLLILFMSFGFSDVVYANKTPTTMPVVQMEEPERTQIKKMKTEPNEPINSYIRNICNQYNVEPELVMSIVFHESRYRPEAKNGNCIGLMQVSTRWHSDRAARLGVKNFYDPYSNILLGVDYLSELLDKYKDPALVLMLYNMKHETAMKMYSDGKISNYARSVLAMAEEIKKGE